jgi:uncharacterized protein
MKLFNSGSKGIEADIERFLNNIDTIALNFEQAVKYYLKGNIQALEDKFKAIHEIEHESDEIRRLIGHKLYSNLLIPDYRADVLNLIENLDNIMDISKQTIGQFSIEKPEIYPFLKDTFEELTEFSIKAVLELSKAVRAFFSDFSMVHTYINKVYYWEHEADQAEEKVKRQAFESEEIQRFSKKVHIRYFSELISNLADQAEAVCEQLAVAVIKREM